MYQLYSRANLRVTNTWDPQKQPTMSMQMYIHLSDKINEGEIDLMLLASEITNITNRDEVCGLTFRYKSHFEAYVISKTI